MYKAFISGHTWESAARGVCMSNQGNTGNHDGSRRWPIVIPALGGVGVAVSLIYVSQVPSGVRWSAFGTALAIAGAAGLVGGIIGFLFGIPHTVQGTATATGGTQYQGNTNLEQVSDWLTKIIVGVGLVQIGRSLPALTRLAASMKAPLGGQASSAAFGLGLAISYALLGFLFLYLWSRERFPQELLLAGAIQSQLDKRESARSTALTAVNLQLDSLKGGAPPTQDELNKVIAAAPDSIRLQIFNEAEHVRSANWRSNKPLMALSIPVFRALVFADADGQYHRNHGSLGWALKDQPQPNWQEASDELTTAIAIRDKFKVAGWKLYEANRALCYIHLIIGLPERDPKIAPLTAAINQDLDAAQTDEFARQMIATNDDIQHWMHPPA
jgi:hypothetical protein